MYSESRVVHMNVTKEKRELKEWFHLFLTSALDNGSVQIHGAGEGYPVPVE
jgi:hypothetical protein